MKFILFLPICDLYTNTFQLQLLIAVLVNAHFALSISTETPNRLWFSSFVGYKRNCGNISAAHLLEWNLWIVWHTGWN